MTLISSSWMEYGTVNFNSEELVGSCYYSGRIVVDFLINIRGEKSSSYCN